MLEKVQRYLMMALIVAGVLASANPGFCQSLERVLLRPGDGASIVKPGQVALSPSGTKFAISDEHRGRIYVFSSNGELLWTVGETTTLVLPTAVCWRDEDVILFGQGKSSVICSVRSQDPSIIDTVVSLDTVPDAPHIKSLDRLLMTQDGSILILDSKTGSICGFSSDWKFDKVLVSHGQGKGKLWSPSDIALTLSGNIVVSDAGNFPLQVFSKEGRFLYFGSWNSPQEQTSWEATAVAVDNQEVTWIADATHREWRLYDSAGILVRQVAFLLPVTRPVGMVVTADHRLVVVDEHGTVILISLS